MQSTYSADMLAACNQATRALGNQAETVRTFVGAMQNPNGGYRGRGTQSDLYYTSFAVECTLALGEGTFTPTLASYLADFGSGERLDFIHLTSLARCWARVPGAMPDETLRNKWERRMLTYRAPEGGFHTTAAPTQGSVSGTFLAFMAFEDLGKRFPISLRMVFEATALRSKDGAYANEPRMQAGTTLATAGMLILRRRMGLSSDDAVLRWLNGCCFREGGYLATPDAPVPDLLSTATVLYAFRRLGIKPDKARVNASLGFVESLFHESGGFSGSWLDHTPDTEYTFYGLLSLGCLAEMT